MSTPNQGTLLCRPRTRLRVKLEKELAAKAAAQLQAAQPRSTTLAAAATRPPGDNVSHTTATGVVSSAGLGAENAPGTSQNLAPFSDDSQYDSGASSDDGPEPYKKVPQLEQREILFAPKTIAECLYHHITTDTILEFLEASPVYDCEAKRWAGLPEVASDDEELLSSFEPIFTEILDCVGKAAGTREVIRSRGMQLHHADDASQFSGPTFSVKATGPSFCYPRRREGSSSAALGYTNIATVFDVRMDRVAEAVEDVAERVAMCNRQIIIHQPNRFFARSLILTESSVRLLHTDRSGSFYTDEVDLHEDPYTFVRLVAGLSSTNEEEIGLDTSVQWTVVDGKRVSGTLTTIDGDGNLATYNLSMDERPITRYTVCGRGTICWRAKDKDGNRFIIKDAWRPDGTVAEMDFLEMAKGLRGVVQMLGHEDMRGQTKVYRPGSSLATVQENRILSRVVLEEYGPSIPYFKSELQVLLAIRDAIIAHRALFQQGVLHRDLSINNILLNEHESSLKMMKPKTGSTDDREEHVYSHLIDLDMAILLDPERQLTSSRPVGTHLYQSISVLESYSLDQRRLAHDYLDDLESFLYILLHLVYGFSGSGEALPRSERAHFLDSWETDNVGHAAVVKFGFFWRGPAGAEVPPIWSKTTVTLCNAFRRYLSPIVSLKAELADIEDDEERREGIARLHKKWKKHYEGIIELFDDVIEEVRAAGADAHMAKRGSKRTLKDDGDEQVVRGAKRVKEA